MIKSFIKVFPQKKTSLLFLFSILFYLSIVSLIVLYLYSVTEKHILSDIDNRLKLAADNIKYILPDDYHDRAVLPDSITEEEWKIVEKNLTDIALKGGFKYLWTDIKYKDNFYLTSSNRTEQTEQEGLEIYYFMKYEKGISSDELKAFSSDKVVFSNFEDKWGKFRAVFVPTLSQSGRLYLSCAEYTVDYVDELLKIGSLISYLIAFSLILAIVPFFAVYNMEDKK